MTLRLAGALELDPDSKLNQNKEIQAEPTTDPIGQTNPLCR